MRKLCFGGSFNPIHNGHLRTSAAVARARGFDRVVLIPGATSPHKVGHADMAAGDDRLAMCKLAVEDNSLFEVLDVELRRPPPSYTIETVRQLRREGWASVHWLIGADQVPALPRWHEAEALLKEAELLVMARPGWSFDWHTLPTPFQILRASVVEAPLIDISATDLRRRIRTGESIEPFTPEPVARYIRDHGLYRDNMT